MYVYTYNEKLSAKQVNGKIEEPAWYTIDS